jgi:hypothetical protein
VTDTIYVKVCQSSTSTACSGELAIAVTVTPPPPTAGNLAVTVRRSDTSAVLPGATVSLSGGPSTLSQTTVSDGTTTFSNLAVGNYTVRASLAEYQANSAQATVVANTTSVAVSLTPSQELTPAPPLPSEIWVDPTTLDPTPDRKAVVITHGWKDEASTWVAEMATAFCKQLNNGSLPLVNPVVHVDGLTRMCEGVNGWDVWVNDWRKGAEWFAGWELVGGGIVPPWNVYVNAISLGEKLADILKRKNYQHIHFIAHSAGANLIDYATRGLWNFVRREQRPVLTIHETFLDAYDPQKDLSLYGEWADWADNYVDTRDVINPDYFDGTKLFLDEAYNIDITTLGTAVTASLDCLSGDLLAQYLILLAIVPVDLTPENIAEIARIKIVQYSCRHSRPYRFYGESIAGDGSFVGNDDHKLYDPIDSTAGMGYPLSVENGHTLEFLTQNKPVNKKCIVKEGRCYADALPLSFVHYLPAAAKEVAVQAKTATANFFVGLGNYAMDWVQMRNSYIPGGVPQQRLAVRGSATAAATPEEPSYLVVNVTTTTPVNTLRFNWSFDTAGEGLLRVFVGGNLVREIDQRYVTPSSPETEEIYIGGIEGPLPPGTHRTTFRLDGFGTSASGVELTEVDLGLLAEVSPTLTVTKAGTGTGTVTSAPAGINCGTYCSESYANGTPVSLTAIPDPGSIFVGWGGNCAADGTVTLDAAKTCTATFNGGNGGSLILLTTFLPTGEKGVWRLAGLQAEGGSPPYTWSRIKGKLPKGLTLDAAGTLSGFPTKAKTATFTVQVTDATGASATQNLSLQIVKSVKLKTKKLSRGTVGIPYAATLKTKGGTPPLAFSLVGGALPPGLTLDPGTGQVFGTPTLAGTFDFQMMVASSGGSSDQRNVRITIK